MKIFLSPWISTKTYPLKEISSISYIFDEKNNICFILKGNISDLWRKIVELQDYNTLYDYASKQHLEIELRELLYELIKKELVQADNNISVIESNKHLTTKINRTQKRFVYLERILKNVCTENNFLPVLFFTMNYNCNLKCKHCFIHQGKNKQQMTFENAKRIIDEAYDLGVFYVYLTGGEASINKDFLKIAEYIRKKYLQLCIFTNAQKFYDDKVLLDKIIDIFPSLIQVSLYSMDEETHDAITGQKGSCYKSIEVINYLRSRNVNVDIACLQLSYNLGHLKAVKEYASSIGASFRSGFNFIYNEENNNWDAKLPKKYMEKYYLEEFNFEVIRKKFEKDNKTICTAGVNKLCITPNLDILPCVDFNYVLGNYNNISLTELRKKVIPEFKKIFSTENLKDCFKYDYCKYCKYCSRNCSDFLGKSQVLCENAQAYQKAYLYYKNKNLI